MKTWIIVIKYLVPEVLLDFTVARKSDFLDHLAGQCPVLAMTDEYVTLTFDLHSADCETAMSAAKIAADDAFAAVGVAPMTIVKCELTESQFAGMEDSLTPDLMGVSEVAQYLGVSKQRVNQLAKTKGFPASSGKLAATPYWLPRPIMEYRRRRAGMAEGRTEHRTVKGASGAKTFRPRLEEAADA